MVAMMQDYSRGLMIALGVVFMALSCVFTALRIWAKRLGKGCLSWDDYLAVAALGFSIICSILQLVAAVHGRLGQHQIVDANGEPILDDPEFLLYEKTKFAVNILAIVGLGCIKTSILLFYNSIFCHIRFFRVAVYTMLRIVAAWTVSYMFTNLFTCWPVTPLIEPFYGNNCMDAIPMWLSVLYSDIVVDIIILIMPIPMVLRLQLAWSQKLAVIGVFMLGALVCATSVTRAIIITKIADEFIFHYNDMTYYTSPVFFWQNIELSLAVVSGCLPVLRPIWSFLKHGRKNSTAVVYTEDSFMASTSRGKKERKSAQYTELSEIALTGFPAPIAVETTIRVDIESGHGKASDSNENESSTQHVFGGRNTPDLDCAGADENCGHI